MTRRLWEVTSRESRARITVMAREVAMMGPGHSLFLGEMDGWLASLLYRPKQCYSVQLMLPKGVA